MSFVPRSDQFDDVYFSVQDGLAETRHVFLDGNDLPTAWAGKKQFTICETGFGTGLNFLAVLQLLARENAPENLHFISFEKYPLDKSYIRECMKNWRELEFFLDKMLSVYPVDLSMGQYDFELSGGVRLTLIFGDVNTEILNLTVPVDCWFLDGFKPSSNPDMWSDVVFDNMARLSRDGAHVATFTAAGFVRRGLEERGFCVSKVKGYGRKREMITARFQGGRACGSIS